MSAARVLTRPLDQPVKERSMVVDTQQAIVDEALQFALGIRGRYIIAQALKYGIEELSKVPSPYQEVSNIEDMQYLKETLFIFPDVLFEKSEDLLEAIEKESN